MRVLLALALAASPAVAWEFRVGDLCELRHSGASGDVRVTYDPAGGDYAIHLTRERAWLPSAWFAIRFEGGRENTISTDRQTLSEDARTLTVRDRGFGNVLDGLEFNATATAFTEDTAMPMALDGAAGPVGEFRACTRARLSRFDAGSGMKKAAPGGAAL